MKPAHHADDWGAVAHANQTEFNTKAKWFLQNAPNHPDGRIFQSLSPVPGHINACTPNTLGDNPDGNHKTPRKCHVHRKHKKNCPKHALHEKAKDYPPHEEFSDNKKMEDTSEPEFDTFVQYIGGKKYLREKLPKPVLPLLAVPPSVGRGLAVCVTGTYCPDARQWVRRQQFEYPDFRKIATTCGEDKLDDKTLQKTGSLAIPVSSKTPMKISADCIASGGNAPISRLQLQNQQAAAILASVPKSQLRNTQVGTATEPPPLLHFPVSKAHCRMKDEVKTHMEHANSTGKIMLRGSGGVPKGK